MSILEQKGYDDFFKGLKPPFGFKFTTEKAKKNYWVGWNRAQHEKLERRESIQHLAHYMGQEGFTKGLPRDGWQNLEFKVMMTDPDIRAEFDYDEDEMVTKEVSNVK
jgi:hypothetical protein